MRALASFSIFGIPVTIRGSFLLIAVLLGFSGLRDPVTILAWVLVVFFSILIHELGHALVARSYGARVEIELNGLGGLTRWAVSAGELSPGRRAVVAAAGSGVGVVFGGIVWVVAQQLGPFTGMTRFVLNTLIVVNLFWGLLNWLPIRPLDGGHLLQSLLAKVAPDRADRVSRVVFTITAAVALALSVRFRLIFVGALSAWLLVTELMAGSQREEQSRPVGLPRFGYDDSDPEADLDPDTTHEPEQRPDG